MRTLIATAVLLLAACGPAAKPETRPAAPARMTPAACAASDACKTVGTCSLNVYGECTVVTPEDCRRSTVCQEEGRCSAIQSTGEMPGVYCGAAGTDCAGSHICAWKGACFAIHGRCMDESAAAEACSAHYDCDNEGKCAFREGVCAPATDAACEGTPACQFEGRCAMSALRCAAVRDEHCRASLACRNLGRCTAVDGECRKEP